MLKPILTVACSLLLAVAGRAAAADEVRLPPLIRIVVPATPGASTDAFARAIAVQLTERTGSNVIVENKAGASTMIGSAAVAKGPKDGSMLLINSTSLLSTAATMAHPPLNVIEDLTPVAIIEENPLIVAASLKSGIKTPADLVTAARARPDTITHGTAGVGTIAHIAQELLDDAANIRMKHVPYKGAALAVTDMAGGVIDTVISTWTTMAPAIQSGRARAIAVTSLQPNPAFPDLPTMASVAPGFSLDLTLSIYAPSGTPAPVVARLNREINAIANSPKLREMVAADGGAPVPLAPEEIQQRVRVSYEAFKTLAAKKHIVVE